MKTFLLLVVSCGSILPTVFSNSLKSVQSALNAISSVQTKKIRPMNAGSFPASPSYAVIKSYNSVNCTNSGNPTFVSYLLNTCMADTTTSEKYTCSNGIGSIATYSDTTCNTLTDTQSVTSACLNDGDGYSSQLYSCSSSTAYNFGVGDYVTISYSQNNLCTQTLSAIGITNGYCMEDTSTSSFKYLWPYFYFYSNSSTCQGAYTSSSISNLGCTLNSDATDDAVEYNSYQSVSYVSTTSDSNSASSDGVSMALWVGVAISCSIALLL